MWHSFKEGRAYPKRRVISDCRYYINSGAVKDPKGKQKYLEAMKACKASEFVFTPRGSGWGKSPLNPNCWQTPEGEAIWDKRYSPRKSRRKSGSDKKTVRGKAKPPHKGKSSKSRGSASDRLSKSLADLDDLPPASDQTEDEVKTKMLRRNSRPADVYAGRDSMSGEPTLTRPDGPHLNLDSTFNRGELLGDFIIIDFLGRGGMGEVYEVEHRFMQKRYALKVLSSAFASRASAVKRFEQEALFMQGVEHPHIVRVDDFGETDGHYWIRMELANGVEIEDRHLRSLQEYVEYQGGRIDQELLAGILSHVLDGLKFCHSKRAIHRDLKPGNILFTTNDRGGATFKISDFGLVSMVGEEWMRSQAEKSMKISVSIGEEQTCVFSADSMGSLVGTYAYMSPEQKRGEKLDGRSDIYSLGLIAFKLLTGRDELGFELPSQIEPVLVDGWDYLVKNSLKANRSKRIGSCDEFKEVLSRIRGEIKQLKADFRAHGTTYSGSKTADAKDQESVDGPEHYLWLFVKENPSLANCNRYLMEYERGAHSTEVRSIRQRLWSRQKSLKIAMRSVMYMLIGMLVVLFVYFVVLHHAQIEAGIFNLVSAVATFFKRLLCIIAGIFILGVVMSLADSN